MAPKAPQKFFDPFEFLSNRYFGFFFGMGISPHLPKFLKVFLHTSPLPSPKKYPCYALDILEYILIIYGYLSEGGFEHKVLALRRGLFQGFLRKFNIYIIDSKWLL